MKYYSGMLRYCIWKSEYEKSKTLHNNKPASLAFDPYSSEQHLIKSQDHYFFAIALWAAIPYL